MTKPAIIKRIEDAETILDLNFDKYELGAWSPSKIKLLEQCPYQFYLKYILKVKNEEYVQDTAMADVGTIAHRILEHVVLGKSVGDAYSTTKREHCEVPQELVRKGDANITNEKWTTSILPLESNIIAFKEKLENFERENKVLAKHTELRLGVTKDWGKSTFFAPNVYFRGILDLIIEIETEPTYLPDGLIIDFKHGGAEFGKPSTKNYQQQLDFYKPLYNFGFRKLSGMTAGIYFVKAGMSAYDEYVDSETIEGKLRNKVEWVIDGAIDRVRELGFFKHIRGNYCQYCEYNIPCKEKVLKENEISTKKYFPIKEIK